MNVPRQPGSQRFRMDPLPTAGPARVAAINQLARRLADDFFATAVHLQLEGMTEDDVVTLLECQRRWLCNLVNEAHGQVLTYVRWAS